MFRPTTHRPTLTLQLHNFDLFRLVVLHCCVAISKISTDTTGLEAKRLPYPSPCKNSSDLYQFQERPLAKVGWTCPLESTPPLAAVAVLLIHMDRNAVVVDMNPTTRLYTTRAAHRTCRPKTFLQFLFLSRVLMFSTFLTFLSTSVAQNSILMTFCIVCYVI